MEQNQPDDPNVYNSGGQVIVQSDRLVFNAKKDSILMYAKNHMHVGINGSFHFNTNNINSENKFIVNIPNMYLGLIEENGQPKLPTEPAVLGDKLGEYLEELIDLIDDICFHVITNISYTVDTPNTNPETTCNYKNENYLGENSPVGETITKLKEKVKDFKSKRIKIT